MSLGRYLWQLLIQNSQRYEALYGLTEKYMEISPPILSKEVFRLSNRRIAALRLT